MFEAYYPHSHVKSVFDIDYPKLYNDGFRGLIFDIDNTLVHHGDDSTPEIDSLFREIQDIGFTTLLLTNNEEKRVKRFIRNIYTLYICDADKPDTRSYLKALEMMSVAGANTIFIGDQLFTDILGANRSNIPNILVDFIRVTPDAKIGKKRYLEKLILGFYNRSSRYKDRLGNIQRKKEN